MLAQGPIESKDGSEEVDHVSACLFYKKLIMSRPSSLIGMAREVVAPLLLHSLRAQWVYPPFPFLSFYLSGADWKSGHNNMTLWRAPPQRKDLPQTSNLLRTQSDCWRKFWLLLSFEEALSEQACPMRHSINSICFDYTYWLKKAEATESHSFPHDTEEAIKEWLNLPRVQSPSKGPLDGAVHQTSKELCGFPGKKK